METLTHISSIAFDTLGRGHLSVEFAKIIRFTDVNRTSHRPVFFLGVEIDAELEPVNAALNEAGFPAVSEADVAVIRSVALAQWTPEHVQGWHEELAPSRRDWTRNSHGQPHRSTYVVVPWPRTSLSVRIEYAEALI